MNTITIGKEDSYGRQIKIRIGENRERDEKKVLTIHSSMNEQSKVMKNIIGQGNFYSGGNT